MFGAGLTGKIVDLDDGTFIDFEWPEELSGTTEMETETAWGSAGVGSETWQVGVTETMPLSIYLIARASPVLECLIPRQWLQRRCYPLRLPGDTQTILKAPARIAVLGSAMIPDCAEWNIVELSWRTMTSFANWPCVAGVIQVNMMLRRADNGMSRVRGL